MIPYPVIFLYLLASFPILTIGQHKAYALLLIFYVANWGKLTSRGNVEDRRSLTPLAYGGLSLTGIALVVLLNFLSGGSVGDVLSDLSQVAVSQQQNIDPRDFSGQDSYEVFASTVLGSANDMWAEVFPRMDRTYTPPSLVLFRQSTPSACGQASSRVGPHYCFLDNTIYLDETFFNELTGRLGAKGGDVAEAYVIAHEVGHHAQHELGILDRINDPTTETSQDTSVKLELQADCFAGLWANSIRDAGVFEPGEINEAMDAAAAVGDDRVQEKVTGQINPETWTHGSSAQRVAWFNTGYNSGSIAACDTFQ